MSKIKNIVYFGTPEFSRKVLEILIHKYPITAVVTQPDKIRGRGNKVESTEVKKFAVEKGINFFDPLKVNTPEFFEALKNLKPDLILVVAYGQILKEEIFLGAPYGCFNVHASLLPDLRGASPIQTALLKGYKKTGVSVQKIVKELDAGDVAIYKECEITKEENFRELSLKLAELGGDALIQLIQKIEENELKLIPQDHSKATFCKKILPPQFEIHWKESADQIHNQVRALYPEAYTYFQGKRVKITSATISNDSKKLELGQMDFLKAQGKFKLLVGTTQGNLEIKSLKLEGKSEIDAHSFVNGLQSKKLESHSLFLGEPK